MRWECFEGQIAEELETAHEESPFEMLPVSESKEMGTGDQIWSGKAIAYILPCLCLLHF